MKGEEETIKELQRIGKPFVMVLNSVKPYSEETAQLAKELEEKYEVSVFPLNCEQLRKEDVYAVLKGILYEFPVVKMNFFLPKWVEMLEMSHPIKENVVANAGKMLSEVTLIKDLMDYKMAPEGDYISNMMMQAVNLEMAQQISGWILQISIIMKISVN